MSYFWKLSLTVSLLFCFINPVSSCILYHILTVISPNLEDSSFSLLRLLFLGIFPPSSVGNVLVTVLFIYNINGLIQVLPYMFLFHWVNHLKLLENVSSEVTKDAFNILSASKLCRVRVGNYVCKNSSKNKRWFLLRGKGRRVTQICHVLRGHCVHWWRACVNILFRLSPLDLIV